MPLVRALGRGLVAGAAGTLALNATTYLDMAVRGRPASTVPADAAQRLAQGLGLDLAGEGGAAARANRGEGLGALLGLMTGTALGAAYGLVTARAGRPRPALGASALTVVAMAGGNGPAALVGVTDPRRWGTQGWLEDVVPHAVYGAVTATVEARLG